MSVRTICCADDNIQSLRQQYPNGLHFAVGDIHGEWKTLKNLMQKIEFDPQKDHVFSVGDYNAGGDPRSLLHYISQYYQADFNRPGFHLIRGNHERELGPDYPLENLPDIIVIKREHLNFYIVHAGMVKTAFQIINDDIAECPCNSVRAYRLSEACAGYDAPLRQIIWSRRGLYTQKSKWKNWPTEPDLRNNKACIIHGHSPYCFFMNNWFSYGDNSVFWEKQHIFFSEDLQSFNLDSNIKGRYENGESYRGLSCVCLEVLEDIASKNRGYLSVDAVCNAENGVFGTEYIPLHLPCLSGNINSVLNASPEMKTINLDENGEPAIKG